MRLGSFLADNTLLQLAPFFCINELISWFSVMSPNCDISCRKACMFSVVRKSNFATDVLLIVVD